MDRGSCWRFLGFSSQVPQNFDIGYLRFAVKLQVVGKTYSKIPPNAGFFHDDLQYLVESCF